MGLKEIYQQLEDKWYAALDKIDAHIPIYLVIDKIDAVVPSFAVFIVLVLAIGLSLASPLLFGQQVTVTVTVEDSEGNSLQEIEVDYAIAGVINSATTNSDGQISIVVPADSSIELSIAETEEFDGAKKIVSIEDGPATAKIVLRKKGPGISERTILFQDNAGQRITGKPIKVRLSCQNPLVTPTPLEATDLDMDGSITVTEPKDCGIFQATVIEPAEFAQKSYILDRSTQTIRLESNDVAKGSLRVRIKDAAGNIVVTTNFDVKLLKDGIKVNEKYSQSYGEAIFSDITSGTYSVSVEDLAGQYAIASQSGISIYAGETAVADIIVSKSIKAILSIEVLDKQTKNGIPNATIRLVNSEKETIAEKSTGEDAEKIAFRLTEQGNYTLYAMHPDYLYELVEVQGTADKDITIEMERITESNSGRVKVRVFDEDSLAVKNARVKLRFLETGMLVPIEPEMTDSNGIASFVGVKPGSYYAYVEKFPASGDNRAEGKEIDIRETTLFMVRVLIGNSLVMVEAIDEDTRPVAEAEAEFFSLQGESLGKIPLTDGTGQFELKADKRVYAVVSRPNFMPVQTIPKQLWPDQTISFSALMEPRLILGAPKAQFEGIFDSSGNQVQQLDSGNRYLVKFKLSIPEEGDFRKGGFHFRVGDEAFLANDPMVVKEAIAGNIKAPLKSTSFSPPLGYEEDSENLTEGDAKWINIVWHNLEPMNYYFGFEIRVKSQITPYTRLPMHYRAWAIDESSDYIRTPDDAELGTAESISSKQALYAKTLDLEFLEGQAADCQEDFCYSGESILDQDKGLYIYQPYEMRAGSPHKFTFSILNNSPRQYQNSELYITVGGLTISSYKVQNASARQISAEAIAIKKIEGVDLGSFTKGKSVSGEVRFTPSETGNASIEVKVIADARVVFLRSISAIVVAEKSMKISAIPEMLPAYVPNNLQVLVKEAREGQEFDLANALVRVKVSNPDKTEFFYSSTTNAFGLAEFSLPPALPNTVVKVEAEKPGYYAEPLTIIVDSEILRFTPSELEAGLDTRDRTEQAFVSEIENLSGIDVTIADVELAGDFRGMLDKQTMLNFSRQHIGKRIAGLGAETLQFFKATLSKNASELLPGRETLEGEFVVTATSSETLASWDIVVPLSVRIAVGGLPDNAPCLIITKSEWQGITLQNKATVEFEVKNHCISGQNFVELENLQAKVVWESDEIGTVELSLTEAESGASNSAVLRTQLQTRFFKDVRPESTYYAMLTFTPKAGHLGEEARFSVNIDAEIMTDSGLQFVGSSPNSLKSSVRVINLEGCVTFPEESVWIKPGQKDAFVTVDSSECGNTKVEFALCWQDSGCKGGTSEGYIQLSTDRFELGPNTSQKEVMVSRGDMPGAYGVTVHAKIPGTSYRKIGEIVVNVAGESGLYWDLDKYTFSIVGFGASDSATLSNRMLEEEVQVTASVCDWGEAQEDEDYSPVGAAAGAGMGSLAGTAVGAYIGANTIAHALTTTYYSTAFDAAFGTIMKEGFSQAALNQAGTDAVVAVAPATGAAQASEIGAEAASNVSSMIDLPVPIISGIVTYAMTGDPIAAIGSGVGSFIGLYICTGNPVCGIVGSIIGSLIGSLFGDDPCEEDLTNPMPDFVINLAGSKREYHGEAIDSDALDVVVKGYEEDISGFWNTIDRQVVNEAEKVGVLFSNSSGIEEAEPIYAIATLRAKEHIHGDSTHQNANVKAGSNFAPYAVPDSYTGEHVQRFHLRFKTKNIPQTIPPVSYDSYECTQGTMIGRTGPGALPRVKFDWSWDDYTGIAIDSCDYENEDYVYCDATQFAIELSKRIQKVEEFMKANEYRFDCPTNEAFQMRKSKSAAFNQELSSQTVDVNTLGLRSMSFDYGNEVLTVSVVVENQTDAGQDATVTVYAHGSSGNKYEETCTKSIANIVSSKTSTVQCVFTNVMQHHSAYLIGATLSSNATNNIDSTVLLSKLIAADETAQDHCWLPPSTDYYKGIPGMSYYIDAAHPRVGQYVTEQSIAWTNEVQSPADLVGLTHFKAYLMQDGYGSDFRQDFAEFYTTSSFFDAPYWFADDPNGKMATYFASDEAMAIVAKYTMDDVLPGPGLYKVDISVTYEEDTWALYDAFGQPNAKIFVQFYRIKEPGIDSIFYYLPFNGYVGLDSDDGRQFYGMNYINVDQPVAIVANPELLTTEEIVGSNSRFMLTTEIEQDFKKINSTASDRGFIMDVEETSPYSMKMLFSPNYATPVVMKIGKEKSDKPFSAFYELRESGTPVETGSNLTFWNGVGQCLDYSGVPVVEAFDSKPDREANDSDPLANWQFAYAADWPKADYAGDVYLKSVFYTPVDRLFSLKAVQPRELRFIAPNSAEGQAVELNGIAGMPHNNVTGHESVDKLRDLFDLVKTRHVCVTNSGTRSAFWWNPKTLYETAGNYTSIKALEQGLVAGQSCIGYGS